MLKGVLSGCLLVHRRDFPDRGGGPNAGPAAKPGVDALLGPVIIRQDNHSFVKSDHRGDFLVEYPKP